MAFFSFQIETSKSSHEQDVNSLRLEFMLSQQELEKEKDAYKGQTEGSPAYSCLKSCLESLQWDSNQ